MCNREKSDYFHIYMTVRSRLNKSYFPFIRDVQPFKTDHSLLHINRILEKLFRFLEPHLPLPERSSARIIDLENLNLLINAVLWHDVGNLYGRIKHEKNIRDVFDQIKAFLYDSPYQEWILKIAEAHTGIGNIEKIEDSQVPIYNTIIYPQFLSALLRISDEIDEDCRRVEERNISLVPNESEAYWRFCICTKSIIPVYQSDSLNRYTSEIQIKCKMRDKDIMAKWRKNTDEVTAIEEYVSRVKKINEERIYCNKFLQEHSALYFHKIDKIATEITISDEKDKTLDKIHFDFTDDKKSHDFFNDDNIKNTLEKYRGMS